MDRRRLSYASVAGGTSGSSNSLRPRGSGAGESGIAAGIASISHTGLNRGGSAISDGADEPGAGAVAGSYRPQGTSSSAASQTPSWLSKIGGAEGLGMGSGVSWTDTPMGSAHGPQYYGGDGRGTLPEQIPLRPSYLRKTRYMDRLEAARRAKAAALMQQQQQQQQQNQRDSLSGGAGGMYGSIGTNGATVGLSASSSSASLQKMAPSHRGMTYEIVESSPPPEEETVPALPAAWKEKDRTGCIEISNDGLVLRCTGALKGPDDAAAVRADSPMPPQCGIFYFEVSLLSRLKEGVVAVGFTGPKVSLERLPGWESESWAYHGDDGKSYCCQSAGKSYGKPFTSGDVIGCGVNFRNNTAFFTRNGVDQGIAFKDIKAQKLFPAVGMKKPGTHIKVNFGQDPFAFDIEGKMESERLRISDEINGENIGNLISSRDESTLLKDLVSQLLRHDGYVNTAEAFAEETKAEAQALHNKPIDNTQMMAIRQDADAIHRQQIRSAVLEGDIDKAIRLTMSFYPLVLAENPDIEFRLNCRKFVEMMRLSHEPLSKLRGEQHSRRASAFSNGHSEQDMELDDPADDTPDDEDEDESDSMDTGDAVVVSRSPESRMKATMAFGTVLSQRYKDDRTKDQALKEIFSLFAYQDLKNSPAAPIMDISGRTIVAEELNSAVLVSLGKSSAAAIEKIYRQTEVLLDHYLNDQGGPGAFVNINYDIRR